MDAIDLLERPVSFHRPLVEITGSICAALMLSQALYWSKKTKDEEGWFYKTQEEWTEETGMTRREQEGARSSLLAAGIWEEKHERLKHRMWYRVKRDELSRMLETAAPECRKAPLGNVGNEHSSIPLQRLHTETTSETTLIDADEVIEIERLWNQLPFEFPKIQCMTEKRKKEARARLKDRWWRSMWREAMVKIQTSDFLSGKSIPAPGKKPWIADIDFFLRPDSVAKIMEGKYDGKIQQPKTEDPYKKYCS